MPRSNSSRRSNKWQRPFRELSASSTVRTTQTGPDGTWIVQHTQGNSSGKVYVCPGCSQDLPASLAHTVAWRTDDEFGVGVGVETRRHWHTSCFNTRHRRR
ncbi:MAG: hypothetical protein QP780_02760 [Brevibacterium sp. UMB1308B]|nr:hypothetical protein [Brevibacterium sp. UMB1308B]